MEMTIALETSKAQELGFTGGLVCALNVGDLGAAIEWYERVLGFTTIYRADELGWAELQTPTKRVAIGISQREAVETGQAGATMTFGVKDIEAARATLEALDVRFDGETLVIEGQVKLATFFDPDGNSFMLYESWEQPGA